MANRMADGNRGKKGEPPNQKRRTNRHAKVENQRQAKNLKKLEKGFWNKQTKKTTRKKK